MFANFYFGTLYLQDILHFEPIETGFAFLPVAVLIGVAAGISQRIVPRFGIRAVAIGGVTVGAAGLALMARAGVHSTYAGNAAAVVRAARGRPRLRVRAGDADRRLERRREDAGLASGLFNTAQQIGGALGLAILATIAATHTGNALAAFGHHATAAQVASATSPATGWRSSSPPG